ncbi:MAG TPA: hypothetical protein VI197_23265 [Polyangiaceae bacterium]
MDTRKKHDARPKHQNGQSDGSQPAARPKVGTHPETVKPDEQGTGPTKKSDHSQRDGRTKDDKDANEQQ